MKGKSKGKAKAAGYDETDAQISKTRSRELGDFPASAGARANSQRRAKRAAGQSHIQLEQKDDRWTGTLEILFVEQGAADRQPTVIGDAMAVNLKKDTYTAALQRSLALVKDLEMADAGYQLKVAVRDANSGAIGTVIVRTQGLATLPK